MLENDTQLSSNYGSTERKIMEAGLLIVAVAVFSILATTAGTGSIGLNLVFSILILLLFVGLTILPRIKQAAPLRNLLGILAGFGSGVWLFVFLRFIGLADWPYGSVISSGQFAWLLYYHFILAVTVLAPILIAIQFYQITPGISWGGWKTGKQKSWNRALLIVSLLGLWIWPVYLVITRTPSGNGSFYGFLCIAFFKAILNGSLEEYCYRGFIQKAAVLRYGVAGGILIQACLYTALHLGLGELFVSKTLFLASIMGLGILFGIITHLTSGIGWACLAHIAIDLAVEWRNLS